MPAADSSESAGAANSNASRYVLKRMRIREAIEAHPDATNTHIAKLIGTSRDTVIDVKRSMKAGAPVARAVEQAKHETSAGEAEAAAGAGLPAVISEGTDSATALVDIRYQTMCRAIAECAAVDEVKDLRDKAVALEVYARQANNMEAERTAQEIRVRAEKQAGKLLKATLKAKGGRPENRSNESRGFIDTHEEQIKTLAEHGITHNQSSQWQKLADVPDETFEAVLADRSEPISATRVIETHRANQENEGLIEPKPEASLKPKRMHADALYLWGLRDVTKRLETIDIDAMLAEMTGRQAFMRADTIANAKKLSALLCAIGEKSDE